MSQERSVQPAPGKPAVRQPAENEYVHPYHWCFRRFEQRYYERPWRIIEEEFQGTDSVLDVGCGDGRLTYLISRKADTVIGVDCQERPLEFARLICDSLGAKDIVFQKGNIFSLDFEEGTFDKVTCFDVIEHLPQDAASKALAELSRVLKSGGRVYLTTPNRKNLRSRIFGHTLSYKHHQEYCLEELAGLFGGHFDDLAFYGIYIPFPIPYADHYVNVFPVRWIFNRLLVLGKNHPALSNSILVSGTKKK